MTVSSRVREAMTGKAMVRARGVQLRRERGARRWAGHGLRGAGTAGRPEGAAGSQEVGRRDRERRAIVTGFIRAGGANQGALEGAEPVTNRDAQGTGRTANMDDRESAAGTLRVDAPVNEIGAVVCL